MFVLAGNLKVGKTMLCFTFFQTQKRFLSYEAFILKHMR